MCIVLFVSVWPCRSVRFVAFSLRSCSLRCVVSFLRTTLASALCFIDAILYCFDSFSFPPYHHIDSFPSPIVLHSRVRSFFLPQGWNVITIDHAHAFYALMLHPQIMTPYLLFILLFIYHFCPRPSCICA